MSAQRRILLFWAILAACGGGDPSATMTASSTPGGDTMTSTPEGSGSSEASMPTGEASNTEPMAGAPVILSFQTDVTKLTAGESVTFTALLTDPDGVNDIVGGALSDPTGMIGYGPFVAAGQEGTYSIAVSWDKMHQTEAIQFEGMEATRVFRAEFYDQAANKVSKDVELTLTCAEGSACDGVCTDVMTNAEHCGACDGVCTTGCQEGSCAPTWGECIYMSSGFMTCDAYCASVGEACSEDGCEGGYTIRAYSDGLACVEEMGEVLESEPCDLVQTWSLGAAAIQCCCTESM